MGKQSRVAKLGSLPLRLSARLNPGAQTGTREGQTLVIRKSFLKRMWNAGEFMKTLKQRFTMSYNSRREHAGTMWEGRYHVRVHKPLVLHASLSLAAGEGRLHRDG